MVRASSGVMFNPSLTAPWRDGARHAAGSARPTSAHDEVGVQGGAQEQRAHAQRVRSRREPGQLVKLSHLGVVPGAVVHLQQTRPAAVIRVGQTTLAVDPEIAAGIYVKRIG